ncbi:MAG: hypothetical protein ACR2M1_08585 [Gemmatimonadaceae bacterium]
MSDAITHPPIPHQSLTDATDTAPTDVQRLVTWSIELSSESPEDAAAQALGIHRDPESIATVFTVLNPDGSSVAIDVENPNEPIVIERFAHPATVQVGKPYRLSHDLPGQSVTDSVVPAGEIVTPIQVVGSRDPSPRWIGVVASGVTVARKVIIPGREWLSEVTIY